MKPLPALHRLAACAALLLAPHGQALPLLNLASLGPGGPPPAPWHVVGLPKQQKPFTQYLLAQLEGQVVLRIEAQASYGNLVHPVDAGVAGHVLSWRWRLDEPNERADLHQRKTDDAAVKVCASYDMPDSAVPFVERQLLRLARARSGEHLPAATVCYVWDPHVAPGTVLDNAYTRRMRMIVLRGEGGALHRWEHEQRDLQADFLRLFGDETHEVPPLQALVVAADADNTQVHSLAHVSELNLE